jgi:hypothetical protein
LFCVRHGDRSHETPYRAQASDRGAHESKRASWNTNKRERGALREFSCLSRHLAKGTVSMSFSSTINSMSLDEIYRLYEFASWAVIIGVAIEEIPLMWMGAKFIIAWYSRGLPFAVRRALPHWERAIEFVGFGLLVIGLAFESLFQGAAQTREAHDKQALYDAVLKAKHDTALEGVRAAEAEGRLGTVQSLFESRVERLEGEVHDLRAAQPRPPTTLPLPPPANVAPSGAHYVLTDDARRIIRATAMPGAIVSIIPFMPDLERFATELGNAFNAIAGIQVAVGHGNVIINGQTGLIVQFDHTNPVSASVFEALRQAGLNPIDGPSTPGPVVFIKVAPQ